MARFPSKELLENSFLADLHLHSRHSRATSKNMIPPILHKVGKLKGLSVIGTGDFTHPSYFKELKDLLIYDPQKGLFGLKGAENEPPFFVLSAEISLIFSTPKYTNRRMHLILIAPSFEVVDEINRYLARIGNLLADGRPTFGVSAENLVLDLRKVSPEILIVPAHAWTPWYSVFGAFSGFNSLEEAFGEATPYICALETGLSSDPEMNWRVSALDRITLISNSDAHSPNKIGREATAFFYPLSYESIVQGIKSGTIAYTVEFYPEEGKYHYDGHRDCGIGLNPKQTKALGKVCPKCGKPLTIGVLHRVEDLADRPEGYVPQGKPYSIHLIPLLELLMEVYHLNSNSKTLENLYRLIVQKVGSEFDLLLKKDLKELALHLDEKLLLAISRMREGKVQLQPGYDGVYGKVLVLSEHLPKAPPTSGQQSLFNPLTR